jgi:hypothetical protein
METPHVASSAFFTHPSSTGNDRRRQHQTKKFRAPLIERHAKLKYSRHLRRRDFGHFIAMKRQDLVEMTW